MKLVVAFAVLLVACKGKESASTSGRATPPAGSATAPAAAAPAPGSAAGSAAAPAAATTDERCSAPCRFLADTPLAEVAAKVKATCGSEWPTTDTNDCAQLDYQRNCIYATAGYTFKKKGYQTAFGKEPWYKARADFKDKDLSAVATANIAELKKQAAACRSGDAVSAADRKIIDAWLAKLQAGKPDVPDIVVDLTTPDDQPTKAGMEESLLLHKHYYATKKLNSIVYRDAAGEGIAAALKGKKARIIEADFSIAGSSVDCGEEDCEGFGVWLVFAIDDTNKIIAIAQGFAACPFAYLVTERGPVLQGEILRNLVTSEREGSQGLAVTLPRCEGRVTFRIAEEKREVSRLDELALVVDGETVLPDACGALCANDGIAHVLAQGDAIDVTFTLPAGARCDNVTLRANGYYDPVR